MKTFSVNYELITRGSLLVKAKNKADVPAQFMKYSLDEIIYACDEGDGPFFCADCDIEEVMSN
ncbi:hypothetical protein MCEGEM3_00847 [Oxalobacteraceae bacterium]